MGAFALVTAGCGAIVSNTVYVGSLGAVGVSLVFGLVIMVMIYAGGHLSGAHYNPNVTIAFALARHFPVCDALPYPEVIAVMSELGIDLSHRKPRLLTSELAEKADVVVTMGCGDACPHISGKRFIDWDLPDPMGRPIAEVRSVRDEIAYRVSLLVDDLDPD